MPDRTPDGRYVIIDGRRWRASDPSLDPARRKELVRELMSARSAVGWAKRRGDIAAERAARNRVHATKVALGERGEKWWERAGHADPPGPEATATLRSRKRP
jgi:uncharacterized protein